MLFGQVVFTVATFGFWANPQAIQYPPSLPGSVKNIVAGKLSCAARLNDASHVQFWCLKDGLLVHNEVDDISGSMTVTTGYGDFKTQTFPDPVEDTACVTWTFANVELSPGTVSYRVTWTVGDKPEKALAGQF